MKKEDFTKSSPDFFRLIFRAMMTLVTALLILGALIPAPLKQAANPAVTPNPVKSAWFLLWIQELVSYSRLMVYPVIAAALIFLLLPWMPGAVHVYPALWFPRSQRAVNILVLLAFLAIVALTVTAVFFRGTDWSFVSPF